MAASKDVVDFLCHAVLCYATVKFSGLALKSQVLGMAFRGEKSSQSLQTR